MTAALAFFFFFFFGGGGGGGRRVIKGNFHLHLSLSVGTHGLRFLRDFLQIFAFFMKIFVFRIEMV